MINSRISRRALIGTVAGASAAVPLAALQSATHAQTPVAQTWSVTDSIRPVLTVVADLLEAPSDEEHVTMPPTVPLPIASSEQRPFEVCLSYTSSAADVLLC